VALLKESGLDVEAARNTKGQPLVTCSGSPVDDEDGLCHRIVEPFQGSTFWGSLPRATRFALALGYRIFKPLGLATRPSGSNTLGS
jgi:hypothetical protein